MEGFRRQDAHAALIALILAALVLPATYAGASGDETVPGNQEMLEASCSTTRLAEVEYLRGAWQVRSLEPARTPARKRDGTSTIKSIAGGCALEEELVLDDGHEEVRILAFDERASSWQLAVVDSGHGNVVMMRGHSYGDGLEFISTHQRSDRLLVDRVLIRSTPSGWLMRIETAPGYGVPWRLLQEINYSRIPAGDGRRSTIP